MKKRVHKTHVIGKPWKVMLWAQKSYVKQFGDDSVGITQLDHKRINLRHDCLTLETIHHELVHAFAAERSLCELNLDKAQVEEFFCELFSKHGAEIMATGREILAYFEIG